MSKITNILVGYAAGDVDHKEKLAKYLDRFYDEGLAKWTATSIRFANDLDNEMSHNDIVILILGTAFFDSDACLELKRKASYLHRKVIHITVVPDNTNVEKETARILPHEKYPIEYLGYWETTEQAWTHTADEIKKMLYQRQEPTIIETVQEKSSKALPVLAALLISGLLLGALIFAYAYFFPASYDCDQIFADKKIEEEIKALGFTKNPEDEQSQALAEKYYDALKLYCKNGNLNTEKWKIYPTADGKQNWALVDFRMKNYYGKSLAFLLKYEGGDKQKMIILHFNDDGTPKLEEADIGLYSECNNCNNLETVGANQNLKCNSEHIADGEALFVFKDNNKNFTVWYGRGEGESESTLGFCEHK
ncbi:MAG: hypothetical protein ACPG5B_04695 [Chitinophagales bacterium]